MAHNIWIENGKEHVFTGNGTPAWHKLGTTIQGAATWQDAMSLAGLDWEVVKDQLQHNGELVPAWGTFRSSDNAFLGAVGERYQAIQNKDAFAFVDALIGNEGAHYDSAGALGNGEVIFCSAHLPSAGFEVVPGDYHQSYLLFKTSHDGSLSAVCKLTDVRVVCQNTLNQALRNGGNAEIKIKHTRNAQERMDMATKLVASGKKTADQIAEKMRMLAQKKVTRETMEGIMTRLFPADENGTMHTKSKNNITDILNLYESNDNNTFPQIRGTAYNLLNACTEYADKYRSAKGGGMEGMAEARAASALFGSGERFKSDAFEYVLAESAKMPEMAQAIYYGPDKPTDTQSRQGGGLSTQFYKGADGKYHRFS